MEAVSRRVAGQSLRLTAEAGSRGLPGAVGASQLGGWLRHVVPTMAPGEAGRRAIQAELLFTDAMSAALGPTRESLLAGDISPAQARVVTACMQDISPPVCPPGVVDPDTAADAHVTLLEHCEILDDRLLAKLTAHLVSRLDPGAGDRLARDEARQEEARQLTFVTEASGMVHLRGLLTKTCGAALAAAIDSLCAPRPAADGTRDSRTAAQRRHDGLKALCEKAIAVRDLLGASHGTPYRATITVPYETLASSLGSTPGIEVATMADGHPLSPLEAQTLSCDAEIAPMLTAPTGDILDVGNTIYPFTSRMRRALAARDRGCTWPGCGAPPTWCQAHHLVAFRLGGRTAVANGALLCGRHHRHVHAIGQIAEVVTVRSSGIHQTRSVRITKAPGRAAHAAVNGLVTAWRERNPRLRS